MCVLVARCLTPMFNPSIYYGFVAILLVLLVGACDTAGPAPDVEVQDLVVGSGDTAAEGRIHTTHYVGSLASTGRAFLTTCTEDLPPLSFILGDPALIEGWNRGLLRVTDAGEMRENGIRRLVIPPALAWGRRGAGCDENGENCDVPGDETVVFLIQLLDVRDAGMTNPVPDDAPCADPLLAATQSL